MRTHKNIFLPIYDCRERSFLTYGKLDLYVSKVNQNIDKLRQIVLMNSKNFGSINIHDIKDKWMNQLFISKRAIPKYMKLINSVDSYFDNILLTGGLILNNTDTKFMELIDKSRLSQDDGYIDTPFGNHIPIINMSTGLKTLILVNHSKETDIIDISQCGQNVVNILFNNIDNKKYYTSFCTIPNMLKIPVKINARKSICKSISDILKVWEERYGI